MTIISETEAEAQGLEMLYKFSGRTEMMSTQYGDIRFSKWLNLEAARISKNPNRIVAIVSRGKKLALFVNT